MKSRIRIGVLALLGLTLLVVYGEKADRSRPPGPPLEVSSSLVPSWPRFEGLLAADTLRFKRGDNLDGLLRRAGLLPADRLALSRAIASVFDTGKFRAGNPLYLLRSDDGRTLGMQYPVDYMEDVSAWRVDDEFRAERFFADLEWQPRLINAELEGSFYESFLRQGEDSDLATRVADLFAGEIDFFFDLQPGDRMELLLESARRPDREGSNDRVLGARVTIGGRRHEAWLCPGDEGSRRYYHRDGSSLEREFLKAPLSYTRISSGFSKSRLHPVLKVHRPHLGVDYAAPVGTPVLATADGSVLGRAKEAGAGLFIKLRHTGKIETTYMHLSRYAPATAPGSRVRKGQVIGYVGSSGMSTGPHLDYRVMVGGKYVDPRGFSSPPAPPLPASERADFAAAVARYDSLWTRLDEEGRRLSLGNARSAASP